VVFCATFYVTLDQLAGLLQTVTVLPAFVLWTKGEFAMRNVGFVLVLLGLGALAVGCGPASNAPASNAPAPAATPAAAPAKAGDEGTKGDAAKPAEGKAAEPKAGGSADKK